MHGELFATEIGKEKTWVQLYDFGQIESLSKGPLLVLWCKFHCDGENGSEFLISAKIYSKSYCVTVQAYSCH
jgi:hypothetical protein